MEILSLEITRIDYFFGTLLMLLCMWLLVRKRERKELVEDPRNNTIRQLDADLRVARRELDELRDELERREREFEEAVTSLQQAKSSLAARDSEVEQLRKDLRDESRKTRALRQELTDQAQEKLREAAIRREAETELEVARAGSEAVADEIERLQQVRAQRRTTTPARSTPAQSAAQPDIDINELLAE